MNINAPIAETRENFIKDRKSRLRPSTMSWEVFWRYFGGAFEHAPDLARTLHDEGLSEQHDSAAGLHEGFCLLLQNASEEKKLQIVNEPPDLAGKLLRASQLTEDSMKEQSSAGLDRLNEAEFARFMELNTSYRARFGFPFIMAVRDRSKEEILAAFETRIGNSPERELQTACGWIERIVLLRLEEVFQEA